MEKIAVIYWSGTGNTELMAKYVAEANQFGVGLARMSRTIRGLL